jgi:aspartyl-tRNA(Asn)/glutamyl-tRNA(Gln) amidotransferase subunit A
VGPITRRVADSEILLRAMAGPDPEDPFSAMRDYESPPADEIPPIEFFRIGVIRDWALKNDGSPDQTQVTEIVGRAISHLVSLGCRRVDLDWPEIADARQAAFEIALADAAEIHREHLAKHPESMGPDIRERLEIGTAMPATKVAAAHHRRALLEHEFASRMGGIDCLVSPTNATPTHAFDPKIGILSAKFTAAFNLLRFPAIALPCGITDDGRPVSLQIAAAPFQEWKVLALAKAYESTTPWHQRHPDGFDF